VADVYVRVFLLVGYFLPASEEIDGLLDVWVPHWLRSGGSVLQPALAQADHCRAVRAVHQQLVRHARANISLARFALFRSEVASIH